MYTFSSMIRYSECDVDSRLTIPKVLDYFQDCSTFHCESVNRGLAHMRQHNYAWFVMAWQIEFVQLPKFCDRVSIGTWCPTMGASNARRYFAIFDEDGNPMVKADSLWVCFDTQNQRPTRVREDADVLVSEDEPLDLPPFKRKIRLSGEGEPMAGIEVTEQDIDTNHHVNNARYIYMADRLVRERDENFEAKMLYAQYKVPAKLGDTIVPALYIEDGGYAVDLADKNGQSYAIVRMTRSVA